MDTPYRNLAVDRVLGVLRAADIEAEVSVPGRSPTASAGEPYFDFIDLSLSQGRNAKAIYRDLVDDHGFTGRYQSVKCFARQLRGRPGSLCRYRSCAANVPTAAAPWFGKAGENSTTWNSPSPKFIMGGSDEHRLKASSRRPERFPF